MDKKEQPSAQTESQRDVPVAVRIRRSTGAQLSRAMTLVNLLALAIAALLFCYCLERSYAGTDDPLFLRDNVTRLAYLQRDDGGDPRLYYKLSMEGRPDTVYDCTVPAILAAGGLLFAIVLESIWLGLAQLVNTVRIKSQLKPLDRLAQQAQQRMIQLSSEPAYSPLGDVQAEKIASLEHAIEDLQPGTGAVRLSTGDADMADLENAINDLLSRMEESTRQQARFVSDASHELRTPIAVVKGYADMLARWGKDDGKVLSEGITAIQAETEHMNKLVEQLLFLARGDSGRTQLQFAPVDLSVLLTEVYEESRMIHPDHAWRFEADGSVMVQADAAMFKQAVRILVDNAVKYSAPSEGIRLRSYVNHRGEAVAEVQDSGIGISESELPHVFERFYRADPARDMRSGGTGLGLSIARWIVDRHGGHFELISRSGIGTRISICLPVKGSGGNK